MILVEITDSRGLKTFLAPAAIASVKEAGPSCQWHGIRAYVRTWDGELIEARDTAAEIAERVAKAKDAFNAVAKGSPQ